MKFLLQVTRHGAFYSRPFDSTRVNEWHNVDLAAVNRVLKTRFETREKVHARCHFVNALNMYRDIDHR